MNKLNLALQVRSTIEAMGKLAVEVDGSEDDFDWVRMQRNGQLEKLVLFAGALASLVIDDVRPDEQKLHLILGESFISEDL
jgi:hypothetical protein